MLNGNSASASELFAFAIQDYNRGILIGSTSLGKATMQSIIALDEKNQKDYVKVTVEKFYKSNGESHQAKGIIPDVILPVLFDSITARESSFKTAFKNERIAAKIAINPFPRTNFQEVIKRSNLRVNLNPILNEIILVNENINEIYNTSKKPTRLIFEDVFEDVHEIDALWGTVKKIVETKSDFKISNTVEDTERLKNDTYLQDINAYKIKNIQTSPYLKEAIAIINDYNNLNQ